MTSLGALLRDGLVVVRDAGRLLWRHWPVLLVLYLLGMAGREFAIYLSVQGSGVNVWLGAAVLPFAPLSLMVAILLMLDAVAPSLRHGPVRQDKLTLLAGALVPFLAVYSAQGYLRQDRQRFLFESITDEYSNDSYVFDPETIQGRTIADVDTLQVVIVILAVLLLRRVLDWSGLTKRNTPVRLFAAWLEVAWLTWLASMLLAQVDTIRDWIEDRVFIDWILDAWDGFLDLIGPLAGAASWIADWVGSLLTDIDALVVVPLAWLTTGAVVYGGTLASRHLGLTATATAAASAVGSTVRGPLGAPVESSVTWTTDAVTRTRERVALLPGPVRSWLGSVWTSVFGRFSTLLGGLRTLAVGGVVPMILFCLAFLLSHYAETATAELIRWVIGPREAGQMVALSNYVDIASTSVSTLLQVALVAAAVDRLLVLAGHQGLATGPTTQDPEPVQDPEPTDSEPAPGGQNLQLASGGQNL